MVNKKKLFLAMAGTTVASIGTGITFEEVAVANDVDENSTQLTTSSGSPIVITEILANSTNDSIDKYDAFEFIEIYNNSSEPLNFKDYTLNYLNLTDPNKVTVTDWSIKEDKVVDPSKTLVIWVKNTQDSTRTLSDFITYYNEKYQTALTEEQVTIIQTAGLHNSNPRRLEVIDKQGKKISSAEYKLSSAENESTHFTQTADSVDLVKMTELVKPSPGRVEVGQIIQDGETPEEPGEETSIIHTVPASISSAEDFIVLANINGANISNFKLHYRPLSEGNWMTKDMTATENAGEYSSVLTSEELLSSNLYYYFTADVDGVPITTEVYNIKVDGINTNYQKIPELLVTELVPDSTNVEGSDGYEYIEVYNNSDKEINMKDYTIRYRYISEGADGDVVWNPEKRDTILQPGETIIYWIINEKNKGKTVADFNANYGTSLTEDQIVKIYSNGMSNSSGRGIVVSTNTGYDVSAAYYFDQANVDDTVADKGIQYTYPQDGSTDMVKYSYGEIATPGSIQEVQKPVENRTTEEDTKTPSFDDITDVTTIGKLKDLELSFNISDETQVKTVQLFYKMKNDSEYKSVFITNNEGETQFNYTIDKMELLGKEYVDYYVKYSDGTYESISEPVRVNIESTNTKTKGLNLTNGSTVSGKVLVKSFNNQDNIMINNTDVTNSAYPALPANVYFAFEANKVNTYFQNGVTMGEEILQIFDDLTNKYTTIATEIDATRFSTSDMITLSVRSGNKLSPFDETSEENRDDFTIKNVRLVLEDGTVLYDPNYQQPSNEITVNDANSVYDFTFQLPQEKFSALEYAWDTTKLADGEYTVKAGSETVKVIVDNTAPQIKTSIEEGKEYKGKFTIDTEAKDASDVESVKVTLDGEAITTPYETSSAKLQPGTHKLVIKAVDTAGNESIKTVEFKTVNEHPDSPEILSPTDNSTIDGTTAKLSVKVSDPTKDKLKVQFFEGYEYAPTDEAVTVYSNQADTEPPASIGANDDQLITNEAAISVVDGEYIETSSIEKFPYHRFEVVVDDAVKAEDKIALEWAGKSLAGRKVSLYVWNYDAGNWEMIDSTVAADENNFELTGSVLASTAYVKDHKVQVIVQDEIASNSIVSMDNKENIESDYDYSFVWMSDTQYYSESYPHIYAKMTQWVADNKEALNIQYVFHTGDLVDESDKEDQWKNADNYMRILEKAEIPYGVLAGNHDVDQKSNDYTEYSKWFGASRFENKDYYGESYKDNRGHYDLISANGNDYIMMYMGWGVEEADMDWMNQVLAEYPDRIAILNFHEYMLVSGNRSPIGNEIYEKVVIPNKNVVAVLSGHYHDAETLINEVDDNGDGVMDRTVTQMLADYQGGPEGGQGYLRLFKVNQETNTIKVETYSPYLNDYNYYDPETYPEKDEFTISVNLEPQEKLVATDAFKVEVLTQNQIATVKDVESGQTVETKWSNLQPNKRYGWYVTLSDEFGGETVSDVQLFSSGQGSGSNNNPDSSGEQGSSTDKVNVIDENQITDQQTIVVKANTSSEDETEFLLTSNFVNAIVKNGKTVELVLPNGTEAVIDKELLAETQKEGTGNINISIQYSKDPSQKFNGNVFSNTIEVHLTKNDTKVSTSEKIKLRIPLSQKIDENLTTSFIYNELAGSWEYAGGYEEDGYWVTMVDPTSSIMVGSETVGFTDTKTHWANKNIQALAAKGIINGITDTRFAPSNELTRKQFTLLLARTLQLPVKEYEGLFPDVDKNLGIDALHLEAAKRYGITTGLETGEFDQNTPISRQQMTVMLIRALEIADPSLLEGINSGKDFSDNDQISDYAKESVKQASALGLLTGNENGEFSPKNNADRAQAATVIERFLKIIRK